MIEFNTLDELKRGIIKHELYYKAPYTDDMYNEELFQKHSRDYTLFEVDLHEDERLQWNEYDGQSYFSIVKIDPQILSTVKEVGK
jgi:hypothetical protein